MFIMNVEIYSINNLIFQRGIINPVFFKTRFKYKTNVKIMPLELWRNVDLMIMCLEGRFVQLLLYFDPALHSQI